MFGKSTILFTTARSHVPSVIAKGSDVSRRWASSSISIWKSPSTSVLSKNNTATKSRSIFGTMEVEVDPKRILITGCLGQIGTELVELLRKKYGSENVIASDVRKPFSKEFLKRGPWAYLNVMDPNSFSRVIVEHKIDWLIHNSSILSATGERDPKKAIDINILGIQNALEAAAQHQLRIFAPSSIAAFGPTTPRDNTPNLTIMRPTTIYGVSKVYLELLGEYYHKKYAVDFRSLRYPGIISSETLPGGGTTDYAVEIFYEALKHGKYTCFLSENSELPMMYMPDCLKATQNLLEAPLEHLTERVYNVSGVSFTPKQVAEQIKKYMPNFEIQYKPDWNIRQKIADSWPKSLDDSLARKDWKWKHSYDLDAMTRDMLVRLRDKLKAQNPDMKIQPLVGL